MPAAQTPTPPPAVTAAAPAAVPTPAAPTHPRPAHGDHRPAVKPISEYFLILSMYILFCSCLFSVLNLLYV
jgi:hypothetical protein